MADPVEELKAMQTALDALTPLDEGGRVRSINWLAGALGVKLGQPAGGGGIGGADGGGAGGGGAPGELGTPRDFMATKKPTTDGERATCLAYYLTHARSQPHFKTPELIALNTEAAGSKISNPSQATGNAKDRNGYLADAGKRQQADHTLGRGP